MEIQFVLLWQFSFLRASRSWLPENKKITINYIFHEILKIQLFRYTKNDTPGHWQEIIFLKFGWPFFSLTQIFDGRN